MSAGSDVDDDLTVEQRRRLERAWRRIWISQLLVLPATLVVVFVVNARLDPPTPRPGHHPVPTWVPWSIAAVLLLVVIPIQFRLLRRRFFRRDTTARALIVSGDRRDIRRVYRSLRRGETISDDDRPIAQACVDSARRQLRTAPWLVLALLLLGAVAVGLPAASHRPVPWFVAVMMILALVMIGGSFVQLRRALTGARAQGLTSSRGERGRTWTSG
ncbi:hypothetical protein [Lapillicoccus jejuensis]|uniref:Uncharacterized protein n=1 Tax=Lapillicoccus jejuensis TaxID=402171 RepID=A0A542E1L8_9MICO|nr:hypothetical protein [Lapillicoccus jejuensis]TQJ09238.1 hypothetical protein FB458_2348 [Lapillicoccus jejuensis]